MIEQGLSVWTAAVTYVNQNMAKAKAEDKKKEVDAIQGASSGEVTRVWVKTS